MQAYSLTPPWNNWGLVLLCLSSSRIETIHRLQLIPLQKHLPKASYPFLKVVKTLHSGCLLVFPSTVLTKTFALFTKSKGFLQGLELMAIISDLTRHGTHSSSLCNIMLHIYSAQFSIAMHYLFQLFKTYRGERLI